MISIVLPIYLPTEKHKQMTEKCIFMAKSMNTLDVQWVIVETGTQYFKDEADIYIYEKEKTTPNVSINRAFKLADGDFVVFLANDVIVCEDWVKKMLECFGRFTDCGIATLGNNEHGDTETDDFIEDIYFSVSMFRKEDAWLDPNYDDLFDDSDMIMRIYSQNRKCYKNLNGIVRHSPHSTYGRPDLGNVNNIRQREYFRNKWIGFKDNPVYKLMS